MANIQVQNVQRLRFQACTSGNLSTDMTTTMTAGAWWDVPFIEGTCTATLNVPTESPGHARQHRDQHPTEILMPESWSLSFQINLGVPDARAATGTTVNQTPVGALLALIMGGEKLAIGDSINGTSATTNVLPVDTIGRFAVGQGVALASTAGVLEIHEVDQISGSTIRLKNALSFTPADGDAVYGCASYYLDNHTQASVKNGHFVLEGLGTSPNFEDCWYLQGGQATSTFSVDLPNNGFPRLTVTFEGPSWMHGDDASMTPAALGTATYSETNEIVCADCTHRITTAGVTAASEVLVTELTVNPDIYYLKHESAGGTNGVAGYVMSGNHPKCTGSFSHVYEDLTYHDARDASTLLAYFYQIGSSEANGAAMISMPTIQITNFQRPDGDGIMMQNVEFKCKLDSDTTHTTYPALAISPIRIHIA